MPDDLSEEEKDLFRKTIASIKTLKKACSSPNKTDSFDLEKNPETLYLSDAFSEIVKAESCLSYCIPSFPKKRFFELKNGRIPLEARIDLHGLRPDTAKEAMKQFIFAQSDLANRCLLIIHGKGSHRGEAPIMKNLVNHWLRQFPQVLAFHSALGRDGGTGAVYVLLKRQR